MMVVFLTIYLRDELGLTLAFASLAPAAYGVGAQERSLGVVKDGRCHLRGDAAESAATPYEVLASATLLLD